MVKQPMVDKTNQSVIWHDEPIVFDGGVTSLIGGKAVGLHQLQGLQINVPPWATLTTQFFQIHLNLDYKLQGFLSQPHYDPAKKAAMIREHVFQVTFLPAQWQRLQEVWHRISQEGTLPLAVRSSAVDEDGSTLSFAGQMDSFLNIMTLDALYHAVIRCWASCFSERSVRYRLEHGRDPWQIHMAVIVQQMIPCEISGVVFTANPLTGNPGETMINAVWGLGEGLVSGQMDADLFILNQQGQVIEKKIAVKKEKLVFSPKGGAMISPVPLDLQHVPVLNEDRLRHLQFLAKKVESFKDCAMDLEFGGYQDVLYLLQARPITQLREFIPEDRSFHNVWDNANIVESYAGVTTPMTFSFIRRAYTAVYQQYCETIGVDRQTIFRNRYLFANMLGLIEGRVYYNLLNWYRLVALMPGFTFNKGFMEQMMGLQVVPQVDVRRQPYSGFQKYFVDFPRLLWVGLRMLWVYRTLPRRIEAFHRRFDAIYREYVEKDYANLVPVQLMMIYRELEEKILWHWKAPILNDFAAMIFYGMLRQLSKQWGLDSQGTLHNNLLCGEGGIKSTQVVKELILIARMIAVNPELKSRFLQITPAQALVMLNEDPEFGQVGQAFHRYLKDFGVRCIEEMKMESIPLKENPVFCIAMIQNYLRQDVADPDVLTQKETAIRQESERQVSKQLRGKWTRWGIPRSTVYRWVLHHARQAIRNRENQRFARTEIYSLIRVIIRHIGRHWQHNRRIDALEDIFYLTIEEVFSYIEGTSVCNSLKELIAIRRKEFHAYQISQPGDHIETYGEVYQQRAAFFQQTDVASKDCLTGLGCCQGVVEATVRVLERPQADIQLNGEILVARQTDPGWVILFPAISGLIVEKGSMLSHSAIVAREMGIPAIVGVRDATRILKSGDRVVLDGAQGMVKIL
jgi:pyruvate,water dikinase